jgi:hypothetical protein
MEGLMRDFIAGDVFFHNGRFRCVVRSRRVGQADWLFCTDREVVTVRRDVRAEVWPLFAADGAEWLDWQVMPSESVMMRHSHIQPWYAKPTPPPMADVDAALVSLWRRTLWDVPSGVAHDFYAGGCTCGKRWFIDGGQRKGGE